MFSLLVAMPSNCFRGQRSFLVVIHSSRCNDQISVKLDFVDNEYYYISCLLIG